MNDKVLIIDNYDSFTFNLRQIIEELQFDYSIIKNDEIIIESIKQYSKILISPGPGIPVNAGSVEEVVQRFAPSRSILGICLGHQAIAGVFGGNLFNLTTVHHGVTAIVNITKPDDYLFEKIPHKFEAGLYHSWAVSNENFPDCLQVTSVSSGDVIMSLSHKEYDVKGVQFHPESIMTKFGVQLIHNWLRH